MQQIPIVGCLGLAGYISLLEAPWSNSMIAEQKVKKTVNLKHSCCSTPPQSRHLQLFFHHPHQTSRRWDDMHFVELNELYKNMHSEKLTRITNARNDMVHNSTKYGLWGQPQLNHVGGSGVIRWAVSKHKIMLNPVYWATKMVWRMRATAIVFEFIADLLYIYWILKILKS